MTEETNNQPPKKNFVDKGTGTVQINGLFDDSVLTDVIPALDELMVVGASLVEDSRIIHFKISSHGGNVEILLALLDTIEQLRSVGFTITTHIRGYADSCASLLAAYGDKGFRSCGPHCSSVIHHYRGFSFISTDKELDREYFNKKRLADKLKKLYLEHSKIKEKDYNEMVSCDSYELDAKGLLDKGLVDFIVE